MTTSPEYIEPALHGLLMRVADLVPDPQNARDHDELSLESLQQSIGNYRQQKPVVVSRDGKTVIAGSGVLAAAKELGWEFVAGLVTTLSDAEAREYALADNRTGDLSYFKKDVLVETLNARKDPTQPIAGWDRAELEQLVAARAKPAKTKPPIDPKRKGVPDPPPPPLPTGVSRMVIEFFTEQSEPREQIVKICETYGIPYSEQRPGD